MQHAVYVPGRPGNGGLIGGAGILCRLRGGLGSCGVDFIDELLILLETEELVLLLMLMEPPALTEREREREREKAREGNSTFMY